MRAGWKYEKLSPVKTALHLVAIAASLAAGTVPALAGDAPVRAAPSAADTNATIECVGQVVQVRIRDSVKLSVIVPEGDDRHYRPVSFWIEKPEAHPKVRSGDVVRLRATKEKHRGDIGADILTRLANIVDRVEILGQEPFPSGAEATGGEIVSGRRHHEFVRVRGIVSSVIQDESNPAVNWFVLRTPSGDIRVSTSSSEHPLDRLLAMTDAEVEVHAFVAAKTRRMTFSEDFLLAGETSIRTTTPPPAVAPVFDDPPRDTETFTWRERRGDFMHKVRIRGLVVAECEQAVYINTPHDEIAKVIPQTDAKRPQPGTVVWASGFVSYDCAGPRMHDAVFSTAPDAPEMAMPKPWMSDLDTIRGRARHLNGFTRLVVSVTGKVAVAPKIVLSGDFLWIEDRGRFVAVDMSSSSIDTRGLIGATVHVTGVCESVFESDPAVTTFPRFMGVTIVPLPQDGLTVLAKPVLTVKILTTIVIHLLLVIGLVSLAWVVLKSRYDRRGRQLFDERVAHVRAQTKTEERTHLATELHDAVSQSLTGIALQIDSANIVNRGDNPALTKCLATARQMLALCRRELRDCLWDLRSRTFDEKDMTEAVSRAIAPHSGSIKATVRFNVPRGLLSESKVHCILSIARELVVNSVRHGKATKIWIAGECSNGRISFSVRDNGCGFDVSSAPGPDDGHFGLRGVCERVRAAKGTIEIESRPGAGTKTTITMPGGE